MLSVFKLSAIILNVVILRVVAPLKRVVAADKNLAD